LQTLAESLVEHLPIFQLNSVPMHEASRFILRPDRYCKDDCDLRNLKAVALSLRVETSVGFRVSTGIS
jgi:hypothetical protein